MGKPLEGKFVLEIGKLRPPLHSESKNPDKYTARYLAKVKKSPDPDVHLGDEVSFRMQNHDDPDSYRGKTSIFDGDVNDIQDKPDLKIDTSRSNRPPETYRNPFIS